MTAVLEIEPLIVPLRTDETGVVRVGKTRVTLDVVIGCYKRGETAEQIVEDFDTLRLADVHGVIAYYLGHQAENKKTEKAVSSAGKAECRESGPLRLERGKVKPYLSLQQFH